MSARVTKRPVHVVYGGAHLFRAETPSKLAGLAKKAMAEHGADDVRFADTVGAGDPGIAFAVATRVRAKLDAEPIEAMTIDFEDGYGRRSDDEEDAESERTAKELARLVAGRVAEARPVVGLRIKSLALPTRARAVRTLERFVTTLLGATGGALPRGFTVTLPKVSEPAEVDELVTLLDRLGASAAGVELMVETPRAIYAADGRVALPALVSAARGRCVAAHLGAYDLTASMGVAANEQALRHPACDHARVVMKLALADTGVAVVDGATTVLPFGDSTDVELGWRLHASNIGHALRLGIYEGWDLHPAQLPARYGALFAYFLEVKAAMAKRLATFVENARGATRVGQAFDDAATGRGLVAFFVRGWDCGALDEADIAATGLSLEELRNAQEPPQAFRPPGGTREEGA